MAVAKYIESFSLGSVLQMPDYPSREALEGRNVQAWSKIALYVPAESFSCPLPILTRRNKED